MVLVPKVVVLKQRGEENQGEFTRKTHMIMMMLMMMVGSGGLE